MAERVGFESKCLSDNDLDSYGQDAAQPGQAIVDSGQCAVDDSEATNAMRTLEDPSRTPPGQPESQISAKWETASIDPDLTSVVNAWEDLPDTIKAGILAMVKVCK